MTTYIPEVYEFSLPGGLTLMGVEYDRVPWVSLTYMVKRGAETDLPGKAGVADVAAEYLTLGTARRNQLELARDLEGRGAALHARGAWDATLISLDGLAEDFSELLGTLAEVVTTPGFPAEELPLLKERRRAELIHLQDDPRELADLHFYRIFFGDSPYAHRVRGDQQSLAAIELQDLQDFYRREFSLQTSTLVVVGMVPASRVKEEAARLWSSRSGGEAPSPPYLAAPPAPGAPGIYLLDRPDLSQSEIRLGHLGLPRSHGDYFPLQLVNYTLGGGGFSSRLMTRIRSEMGATYGIRSAFQFRRAPGPFVVATFTPAPQTAEVVKEIKTVLEDVQQQGVTAQELAEAQSYYVGHFPLGLETSGSIGRHIIPIDLYGLGRDYLERYPENIRGVTLSAARQAAAAHLHPESLVVLVVGPARVCAEELAKLGPVQIIQEN